MGLLLCDVPEAYGGSGGTLRARLRGLRGAGVRGGDELRQARPQHLCALRARVRHRGAEAALAAAARERRARRRHRDVRARRGLGPAGHPDARGPPRRCLRPRRLEDLHLERAGREPDLRGREHGSRRPAPRAYRCSWSRPTSLAGFRRGRTLDKIGLPGQDTVRALLRRLPRARGEPARRRRGRGLRAAHGAAALRARRWSRSPASRSSSAPCGSPPSTRASAGRSARR